METNTLNARRLATLLLLSLAAPALPALADGPSRIVAVGDIHGELEGFRELIHEVGLTDAGGAWTGGDAWLISLGDVTDRGPQDLEVLRELMRLQGEARAAGGEVEMVLGNHEVMNLTGELRYVHPEAGDPALRRELFAPDGELGAWLLERPVMLQVGDTVFAHGGFPEDYAGSLADRDEAYRQQIATYARAWLAETEDGDPPFDTVWSQRPAVAGSDASIFDIEGPTWTRRATMCHPLLETTRLEDALAESDAMRMVVGHTPTASRRIETAYDGQLVMADTGMYTEAYRGTPNALVIEGDSLRAYDAGADHWYQPQPRPRRIGPRPGGLTDDQLEEFLATATVVHSEEIGEGVTRPLRVTLERDGITLRAAFKAEDTGEPRGNRSTRTRMINNSDRYQYEIAAYRLDRYMGLDLIPVAVARQVDGRDGVLTFWVDGSITESRRQRDAVPIDSWCPVQDQYLVMDAFDALIYNVDRNLGNIMYIQDDWSLVLIDHSRGFRLDRGYPGAISGEPRIPHELAERFALLDEESLDELLSDLLHRDQIRALLRRRDEILEEWPRY